MFACSLCSLCVWERLELAHIKWKMRKMEQIDALSFIGDNTSRHLPAPAFLRYNFSTATAWVAVQIPWLDRPEFDAIVQHETTGEKSKVLRK